MDQPYYTGVRLLLLNIALGLGTFIQILDISIANVAIPYIAGSLAVSPDQGTWVITSFAASNAIVLPLTGWLSNYFGRVHVFVYSIILFSITSFFCGFSHNLTMLVTFRVLQGAVAGSLIPLSQSLLVTNNPPDKRGTALGFWSAIVIVAPVIGPILGGYLSEEYSWPWIFYINVPIGFFSALVTWALLKDRESQIKRVPIDWIGLLLLAIGVGALQIMLDKGRDLDWFESNTIITLLVTSLVALIYFGVWNHFQKHPIVDFSFFLDRNFTLGTIITTLGYVAFFGSTVIIPLWLQTQQGYTAFWAGVAVAPIGIFPIIVSPLVGKYLQHIDMRILPAFSFFLFAIGFFLQANFTTQISLDKIMLVRLFQGVGLSIFFIPLVQLSLGNISNEQYASASGLYNFIRILFGSGFGTSLSIELWNRLATFYHSRLVESITVYRFVAEQFYASMAAYSPSLNFDVVNRILDQLITQEAFMLSTNDMSWLGAWVFIFMIPIPFLCKRIQLTHSNASSAH